MMLENDIEAAVTEFIRTKGITRCPTACVLPTQGLVGVCDQAALKEHAIARNRFRQAQAAARWRQFLNIKVPRMGDDG
jgi:hypothetical protein